MKYNCTKVLSCLCLMLFLMQVVFGYSNNYEKSNSSSIYAVVSSETESNRDAHNPFESSSDNPEQEEQEESHDGEEGNELEVFSDDSHATKYAKSQIAPNYFYLFKLLADIFGEKFSPPDRRF